MKKKFKEFYKPQFTDSVNLEIWIIIDAVCKEYDVDRNMIFIRKNDRMYSEPRQIIMALMYYHLRLPMAIVGQYCGGRDHSTVVHARQSVCMLYDSNKFYASRVRSIVSSITSDPDVFHSLSMKIRMIT